MVKLKDTCKKCGANRTADHQLGSEPIADCAIGGTAKCGECHVCCMVAVFREIHRVLRDDGTVWMDYGDTYGGGKAGGGVFDKGRTDGRPGDGGKERWKDGHQYQIPTQTNLASGNLMGIPWRVALGMQADGWILRQDIIWCLSGGTWVYARTQKGEMPMMIRDAARLDPKTVKLWNGEKWTQVLGWSRTSRNADELELVLRSGERISCTPTHQFPTAKGLMAAGDLEVGDTLTSTRLPEPAQQYAPPAITNDAAWFVGLYLAEGSISKNTITIAGHKKETERWERVKSVAEYYGGSAKLRTDGNNQTIAVHGRLVVELVRTYIGGTIARDKHMTNACWKHSNVWLSEFLLGYLSGDGSWDASNERWRLNFCRNYSWERDLRVLSARLGFRLVLIPSTGTGFGNQWETFRGEIRFVESDHHNRRDPNEIVEIRKARCREVYDVGVEDDPHTFALASGVLTHNSKPSVMPESVRNRCTKAHEYVFLFAKKQGYFYDGNAIREPLTAEQAEVCKRTVEDARKKKRHEVLDAAGQQQVARMDRYAATTEPYAPTSRNKRSVWSVEGDQEVVLWLEEHHPDVLKELLEQSTNKSDVWRYASAGYDGAHFATFPQALIQPMIMAGTSEKGACAKCGAPWTRVVSDPSGGTIGKGSWCEGADLNASGRSRTPAKNAIPQDGNRPGESVGWEPGCSCKADVVPCVVLDPFIGSGTSCAVSLSLGRRSVGIDLNRKYLDNNAIPRIEGALSSRPALARLVPRKTPALVVRGSALRK